MNKCMHFFTLNVNATYIYTYMYLFIYIYLYICITLSFCTKCILPLFVNFKYLFLRTYKKYI